MELNDKIKQILVDKSISPSHFADEIGVQRSSISHIIAGRNRPSLDIIQKIIRRYPDLGMDWIMDDEDMYEETPVANPYVSRSKAQNIPPKSSQGSVSDSSLQKQSTNDRLHENHRLPTEPSLPLKTVERILVFYTDGTFKQYTPDLNN